MPSIHELHLQASVCSQLVSLVLKIILILDQLSSYLSSLITFSIQQPLVL